MVSPREGCKLVIRNSKSAAQEEYLVDAIEIVRFGSALFFRSLERPKSFILPVSDYEVMEVRETRVVLKHAVSGEKSSRPERRKRDDKRDVREPRRQEARKEEPRKEESRKEEDKKEEPTNDEPKPKRRRQRRRKRDDEGAPTDEASAPSDSQGEQQAETPAPAAKPEGRPVPSTLLPPPTTLISDSIGHYKKLMTEAEAAGPIEKSDAAEPLSSKIEEPALVPPGAEAQTDEAAKGLGVFSAGRFLRRLAGQEKEEGEPNSTEE